MLAISDWSNKIMNTSFVHDIMKMERENASLFAFSDWSNRIMNTVYRHDIIYQNEIAMWIIDKELGKW